MQTASCSQRVASSQPVQQHPGASRVVRGRAPVIVRCAAPEGPSTSGTSRSEVGLGQLASRAWAGITSPVGVFSATCASGLVALVPTLAFGGPGGPGQWGGNGGGGGGDGHGGSSAGQPGGQNPLFDVAADELSDIPEDEKDSKDSSGGKWKDLITPTDEIDAVEGQRSGTNRCVEIVIEGWPKLGALPSKVS
jgi:hypothetical protein